MAKQGKQNITFFILQFGILIYQLNGLIIEQSDIMARILKSIHILMLAIQFFTLIYCDSCILNYFLQVVNNCFLIENIFSDKDDINKTLICIYHTYFFKNSKTYNQKVVKFLNNLIYSAQIITRIIQNNQKTKTYLLQSFLLMILMIECIILFRYKHIKKNKIVNNEEKQFTNLLAQQPDTKVNQQKYQEHSRKQDKTEINLEQLLNVLPLGIVIINKKQELININTQAKTLLEEEYGEIQDNIVSYLKKSLNRALHQQNQTKNFIQFSPQNVERQSHKSVVLQLSKQSFGMINRFQSKSQFHRKQLSNQSIKLENKVQSDTFDAINYILDQQTDQKGSIKPVNPNQLNKLIKKYKTEQIDSLIGQNYLETVITVKQGEKYKRRCIRYRIFSSFLSNDKFTPITIITLENKTKKIKYNDQQLKHQFQSMLLNSFSHELKTPLNSSLQLLETFEQLFSNSELLETYIRPSLNSLRLLAHQFNDILDFASFESNQFKYQMQSFSMIKLLNQCKSFYLEAMKAKELELQIVIDSVIDEITNDAQRITQVLITLLNNSIKFTNRKGKITMKFKSKIPKLFKIIIQDDGVGIEQKKLRALQKCLSSFDDDDIESQLKDYDESQTGLGLKIASKIVSGFIDKKRYKIDNQFKIKSKLGEFTKICFYVQDFKNSTIRLDSENMEQVDERQQIDQSISLDQISIMQSEVYNRVNQLKQQKRQTKFIINQCSCAKILIVDDVPFNHYALNIQLTNYKLISDSVFNGQEAIDKVKEKFNEGCGDNCRHGYYLILMDIQMPVKDGYQASFEKINEFFEENDFGSTQIIICSAFDSIEHRNQAKICGVNKFLPKPVKRESLHLAIKDII